MCGTIKIITNIQCTLLLVYATKLWNCSYLCRWGKAHWHWLRLFDFLMHDIVYVHICGLSVQISRNVTATCSCQCCHFSQLSLAIVFNASHHGSIHCMYVGLYNFIISLGKFMALQQALSAISRICIIGFGLIDVLLIGVWYICKSFGFIKI